MCYLSTDGLRVFKVVSMHQNVTMRTNQKVKLRPMSMDNSDSANDLVRNSSLYREFQAEREEILKHKWIESEKVGYDIGFERALTDWIIKHRSKWRKSRQQVH
jgi:hypothetical protein